MFLFGKKRDNGFNDFQILVASLRSKQGSIKNQYDLSWKGLARSIELGRRNEILSKLKNEYRLKQHLQYINEAVELGREILKNYQMLWAEHPSREVQDKYVDLSGYIEVLGVPQLGVFIKDHPLAGEKTIRAFTELDEGDFAEYLQIFAVSHGVNKTGLDNLEMLFPAPQQEIYHQAPMYQLNGNVAPFYPPPPDP